MAFKSKYTSRDTSVYDRGFQGNSQTNAALNKKTDAENALKNLGDFSYKNQAAVDSVLDAINNRKPFSYDLNADALYRQYKDNYINQGRQAMMDTMGQAATMTGGYGNSYAATVGNQTYQGYLQNLNSIVPELYQMAMSRYQMEGDQLNNKFSVLQADKDSELNIYNTKYSRLAGDRDYYANDYHNIYNTALSAWNSDRDYNTSQFWNEHNAGYKAEQDAVANALAQKEYDLKVQQLAEQKRANDQSKVITQLEGRNKTIASNIDAELNKIVSQKEKKEAHYDLWDKEKKYPYYTTSGKSAAAINKELNSYLNTLVNTGVITQKEATDYYGKYIVS